MIEIKKEKLTGKDVKNKGCSQYITENKGQKYTTYHKAIIFMKIHSLSEMPLC
jgi:ribosomal protein S26